MTHLNSRYSAAGLGLAVLLVAAGSCAVNEGKTSPPVDQSPMPTLDPVAVTDTVGAPAARNDSALVKDTVAGAKPAITVPSVSGRSKKDSLALVSAIRAGMKETRWPVNTAPPLPGAILPSRRIVAYYGNPLSRRMGILGEIPPDQMLARLDKEVAAWNKADPAHPVVPALHLIVVVAQGAPGRDGKYRLRMPDTLVEKVSSWAAQRNALIFLDVQVGKSTVQEEIPRLAQFLKRPNVHLGLDPEFSMKFGDKPGVKIGTMNAEDVNFTIRYLSDIVNANNIPPKVLVIHRFTRNMLTGSKNIRLDPGVQVVIDMDGWGNPWLKYDSYRDYVQAEPVQFTGFKLFYHNDTKKGEPLLTPSEVLKLTPPPMYIQYQ
ncbi:MAG: hypothetical protein M3O61_13170 [Gemmatimonadota bacterium]|nr:hypothetical protein [Gemmatimonadota bacterium]